MLKSVTMNTSRRDVTIRYAILLGLILLVTLTGSDACSGNTCAECIGSGAECAWCADMNFTNILGERCGLAGTLRDSGCMNIQNPKTVENTSLLIDGLGGLEKTFRHTVAFSRQREKAPAWRNVVTNLPKSILPQNETVKDGNIAEDTEAIQLQPQALHIKLRPRGRGHEFSVTFRPANNFPVDLYFLYDLSSTMKEYISDFAELAHVIAAEINKISTNYMMGYGTFQDKVLLPFTNIHPVKLQNPCPTNNDCAPPFDFRHELNLTRDIDVFKRRVDWSTGNTTGNIDRPEGGFDAMMQAIVCKKVGWRDNSRQLIILASDDRMHFAGDGKLGGLITPNDGRCHLDDGRTNSMSKIQDYPSVGQISEALDRTKKHVIFAVVGEIVTEYQKLVSRFSRFSVDQLKGGDDSNVVAIVRDKYREMTKGVKLEATPSNPDLIQVSITPTCTYTDGVSCTRLNIGETVKPFKVRIRAERCPEDPKDRIQHVIIAPSDFRKDRLNVTVEIICDCDCQLEADEDQLVPSDQCSNGNGTMECGICRCFEGRSGALCECGQQDGDSSGMEYSCREEGTNSTQTPECSGLGQCVCGVCQCPPDYSGRYCQCNDKVCPTYDGLICAGHGECRCEECYCAENYTGHACECPVSTDTCVVDGEEKVCSGHGTCKCGQCVCDSGYLGSRCQTCFSCGDSVCEDDETYNYRQCALCVVTSDKTCPDDCPEVIEVEEVDMEDDRVEAQREVCRDYLTDDCHIRFAIYNPGTVNTTLHVQRAKVCTEGPDILLIVLGVVGGVVGVGLILLLLVKLLTSLFDRLEYQHFLKELQAPKWAKHNNPIYKEATTTYYNPVMSRD